MTTEEVANALVKFCSEGKLDEAINALYSPDIVSVEAGASRTVARGKRIAGGKSEDRLSGPQITISTRSLLKVLWRRVRISRWSSR